MKTFILILFLIFSIMVKAQDSIHTTLKKVFFFDLSSDWKNTLVEKFSSNKNFMALEPSVWASSNLQGAIVQKKFYDFLTHEPPQFQDAKDVYIALGYDMHDDSSLLKSTFAKYVFDNDSNAQDFFDNLLKEVKKYYENVQVDENKEFYEICFGFMFSINSNNFFVRIAKSTPMHGNFRGKYLVDISLQVLI